MPQLTLCLLGPWQATLAGKGLTQFRYDRARALLSFLAVEADHPHRRETLMGMFWPELPESAARNNLRQVLHALRDALGDRQRQIPFVLASRATLQFNPDASYVLDVRTFTTHLTATRQHDHRGLESCQRCARELQQAVDLYRGPFLADFFLPDSNAFESWATARREWLQQQALDALGHLAAFHERRGQYELARRYVQRLLALEPWREASHRTMMRLYALEGLRGAALAQYEQCRRLLDEELGVIPEAATTALYEQIRDATEESPLPGKPLSLPARRPHSLPPAPTPFVGRERELSQLATMLAGGRCRLVTLTGPGGVGKSRLALQAAVEQIDAYADGVFFVPLADLTGAEQLAGALTAALGLQHETNASAERALLAHLRSRHVLLLLDNFEHLLDGADLLSQILRHAAGVALLVTSRERLNLRSECVFRVTGLSAPPEDDPAADSDAVTLFVQSAQRARHDFAHSPANRDAVARICHLVDGLPLALELSAAWVQTLSCAEIAQQIEADVAILKTDLRDMPQRHRSLAAVFEHSWRLLSEEEQGVLRRLAVFRGGFRQQAAVEICSATLDHLRRLAEKSLLKRDPSGRYYLHALLQHYAAGRLAQAGETEQMQARHYDYFLQLAETGGAQLRGPHAAQWLARLEEEHANLRAALAHALSATEGGPPLAAALWPFWYRRGYLDEGRRWLAEALAHQAAQAGPALRASLHHGAGVLAWNQGDYSAASEHYERSLILKRELGDEQGVAALLNNLGNLALDQGHHARAKARLEESLAIKRQLGDRAGIAASLGNLGTLAYDRGDYDSARAYLEESVALKHALGDHAGAAIPLGTLGAVALEKGELALARELLEESLQRKRETGDRWGIAMTLADLVALELKLRQLDAACKWLYESLDLRARLGDRWSLAHAFQMSGRLALAKERPRAAAQLWGAATALRERIGAVLSAGESRQHLRDRQAALARLEEATFTADFEKGRRLAVEEAIALARSVCVPIDDPAVGDMKR